MKKEEWGLMTVAALLSSFLFPPYFLHILAISGLASFAMALKPSERPEELRRLIEFEQAFRVGHDFEEQAAWVEAIGIYRELAERYKDDPAISGIAVQRIRFVEERQLQTNG